MILPAGDSTEDLDRGSARRVWIRLGIVVAAAVGLLFVDPLLLPSGGFSFIGLLAPPVLVWFALFLGLGFLAPTWSAERRAILAWGVYLLVGVGALLILSRGQTESLPFLYVWPSYLTWLGMCDAGWWCPFS